MATARTPWTPVRSYVAALSWMIAAGLVFVGVPVGLMFYFAMLVTVWSWPESVKFPIGSSGERAAVVAAAWATALKRPAFRTVWFMGGPGESVREPGQEPALVGALRLSGVWCWIGGLVCGVGEWFNPLNRLGVFSGVITGLVMVVFWSQVAVAARGLRHVSEPCPAALCDRSVLRHVSRRNTLAGLVVSVLVGVGGLVAVWRFGGRQHVVTETWLYVLTVFVGVLSGFGVFTRLHIRAFTAAWKARMDTVDEWQERWQTVPRIPDPPHLALQTDLPEGVPTHSVATFAVPRGADVDVYIAAARKLAAGLQSDTVLVTPMQEADETGRSIAGTAGMTAFQVSWALQPLGQNAHLRADLDPDTRAFVTRYAVTNAVRALKIAVPTLIDVTLLSEAGAPVIVESRWALGAGTTMDDLAAKTPALTERLGAKWCRVGRREGAYGLDEYVSILFGERHPRDSFLADPFQDRPFIDTLDWDWWFRVCKLVGGDGLTPRLLNTKPGVGEIDELTFSTALGVAVEKIEKAIPDLMASSGLGYIAVEEHKTDADKFHVITGRNDPLKKLYLFADYEPQLLHEATRGELVLPWKIGVGADGEVMTYLFDSEEPHMLIAGATSMGKSAALNVMLVQLLHNNTPDDLAVKILEPKNEMQVYQDVAHVVDFVDQSSGNPYECAARIMAETLSEMHRRYALMTSHDANPQKLSEARLIAAQEGVPVGLERHPLDLPAMVVVVEECTNYFTRPTVRDYKGAWEEFMANCSEVIRLGRAAGIHCVFATQFPSKEAIPQMVKQNCRRVGFGVGSVIASQVVIDRPGLERIKDKGRGMMTYGKGYRGFRSFLIRRPDEKNPDVPDDRQRYLDLLPHREGAVERLSVLGGDGVPRVQAPAVPEHWRSGTDLVAVPEPDVTGTGQVVPGSERVVEDLGMVDFGWDENWADDDEEVTGVCDG